MLRAFLTIFSVFLFSTIVYGQEEDSLAIVSDGEVAMELTSEQPIESFQSVDTLHSPRIAALYSAVLPGLGQIYNGKFWKVPIIYGLGALAVLQIRTNDYNYKNFRNALFAVEDQDESTVNPYATVGFNAEQLERRVEAYRRDRDYWIIIAGAFYVLNIVDAVVDAHLNEFNINDNLSMDLTPSFKSQPFAGFQAGLSLNFRLK